MKPLINTPFGAAMAKRGAIARINLLLPEFQTSFLEDLTIGLDDFLMELMEAPEPEAAPLRLVRG